MLVYFMALDIIEKNTKIEKQIQFINRKTHNTLKEILRTKMRLDICLKYPIITNKNHILVKLNEYRYSLINKLKIYRQYLISMVKQLSF